MWVYLSKLIVTLVDQEPARRFLLDKPIYLTSLIGHLHDTA